MHALGLVFSRDRPLQLDGALRSLVRHCRDAAALRVTVVYRATSRAYLSAYAAVEREHAGLARFVVESSFEHDVRSALHGIGRDGVFVLTMVDDTLFVRPFTVVEAASALMHDESALALSLRLAVNTTYSQPAGVTVAAPEAAPIQGVGDDSMLRARWVDAAGDYGYPFDLSSSVYRGCDLDAALGRLRFDGPNRLEHGLWEQRAAFAAQRPQLLFFRRARGFAVPVNRVQDVAPNPTSEQDRHDRARLLAAFRRGWRIDVAAYDGFSPPTCHFEIDLLLRRGARTAALGAAA